MSTAPGSATDNADILFERRGGLAVCTLNRPRAVNALTAGMVEMLLAQLTAWEKDDDVSTVLIQGAGERGLCAGGDIVAIYEDMLHGGSATADFWQTEYRVNSLIARYPKPYVALMDGLVLGGGVGISAHGDIRVVTERTRTG
ncbi:MAG TPA: enoyl-CoA hydratase/isomerase family protein, partial [Arthrobacter sp.]